MVFDSRDNAKDVLLNSTLQVNTGAVSSSDKSDFYKFQVNGSSSAFISLNALSADANLILSTASGQQLAASTRTDRTSEAISANLTAGTYYIQVVQNSGNTTYNLSLSSNNIFANIGDGDTNYIRGSSIKSYNNTRLDFQDDGNLVVYNSQGRALWATGTYGTNVDRFAVQADGNMVLYAGNKGVWASDTAGNPGSRLAVQEDGNVVVYRANGQAAFNTGTWGGNTSTFAASSEWLKRWGGTQLIPAIPVNQFRAEYFNNNSLSGQAAFTQLEDTVNKDWGLGGPGQGVGNDNFSVRWTGKFNFDGGNYNFSNSVDDGMRIWIDGNILHDSWTNRSSNDYTKNLAISAGQHDVKVEYREDTVFAVAKVSWGKAPVTPVLPANQFRAEYFNNNSLAGQAAFMRIEDAVSVDWKASGPGNGVGNDNFSVRWTGKFNFDGGNYNFSTSVDDGMKIWIGGNLIHDTWTGRSSIDRIDNVAVAAGQHDVKVEYREDGGAAMARVSWEKMPAVLGDNNIYTRSSDINYARGSSIKSNNNNRLDFQADGNLVVYNSQGRALWATGTHGTNVDRFAVQADGNMVLYAGSKAVWASDTSGNPGDRLSVQADGNVVVYRANGQVIFNTGTSGGQTSTFAASSEWLKRYEASPTGSTGNPFQDAINRVGGQSVVGTDWNNGVHTWGSAQVQDFRNGDVLGILMKADGTNTAYWVSGDFLKTYYESRQMLGNPTSDRYASQGGWRQDFEGGPITKDAQGRMMVSPTIAAINAQPKILPPTSTRVMGLPGSSSGTNPPVNPQPSSPTPGIREMFLPNDPRNPDYGKAPVNPQPSSATPGIREMFLPTDPRNPNYKPPVANPQQPVVKEIFLPTDPRNPDYNSPEKSALNLDELNQWGTLGYQQSFNIATGRSLNAGFIKATIVSDELQCKLVFKTSQGLVNMNFSNLLTKVKRSLELDILGNFSQVELDKGGISLRFGRLDVWAAGVELDPLTGLPSSLIATFKVSPDDLISNQELFGNIDLKNFKVEVEYKIKLAFTLPKFAPVPVPVYVNNPTPVKNKPEQPAGINDYPIYQPAPQSQIVTQNTSALTLGSSPQGLPGTFPLTVGSSPQALSGTSPLTLGSSPQALTVGNAPMVNKPNLQVSPNSLFPVAAVGIGSLVNTAGTKLLMPIGAAFIIISENPLNIMDFGSKTSKEES
jgi:PA14 domain/Bacterial pre-peptidase C-terminal domain